METFPQIILVSDQQKGLIAAKDLIYRKVNDQTLFLLSGGSTPKDLYRALAVEGKLKVGAVGMVDERIDKSNFEMIKSTGLLDYLGSMKIKFYPIDSIGKLINSFKHRVAIMGIGEDGHTASIPAGIRSSESGIQNYVDEINNFPITPRERITLTFKALSEMDLLIVLAFGENKKGALKKMFEKGTLSEIPARFYIKPEIAKKTILITDQKI